jgi:hypothetical protein
VNCKLPGTQFITVSIRNSIRSALTGSARFTAHGTVCNRDHNAGNARFTAQGALRLNAAAWTSALAARTAINILPLMKQGRE